MQEAPCLMIQDPGEWLDVPRFPAQRHGGLQDGGRWESGPLRPLQHGAGAPLLVGEDLQMPIDARLAFQHERRGVQERLGSRRAVDSMRVGMATGAAGASRGAREGGRAAVLSRSGIVDRLGLCLCIVCCVVQHVVSNRRWVCLGLDRSLGHCSTKLNSSCIVLGSRCCQPRHATSQDLGFVLPCCSLWSSKDAPCDIWECGCGLFSRGLMRHLSCKVAQSIGSCSVRCLRAVGDRGSWHTVCVVYASVGTCQPPRQTVIKDCSQDE